VHGVYAVRVTVIRWKRFGEMQRARRHERVQSLKPRRSVATDAVDEIPYRSASRRRNEIDFLVRPRNFSGDSARRRRDDSAIDVALNAYRHTAQPPYAGHSAVSIQISQLHDKYTDRSAARDRLATVTESVRYESLTWNISNSVDRICIAVLPFEAAFFRVT